MTGIGTQPAARITPLATTAGISYTESYIPVVRQDNDGNYIHGNYASIYLREKPLQSAGITIAGMTSVVAALPDATHFSVDYKEGYLFFLPTDTTSKTVTYTGTGALVDAEKLLNNDYVSPNVVHILPDAAIVEGKIYKTYLDAVTYIATQTPSAASTWTTWMHGTVTEDLDKKDYIAIKGDGISTRLLGMITTSSYQADDFTEITDCYVEQFAFIDTGPH